MDNPAVLFWGMIFGAIGAGFFVYGKKQQRFVPLLCGLLLAILPYCVTNTLLMILLGVALSAVPYFLRY